MLTLYCLESCQYICQRASQQSLNKKIIIVIEIRKTNYTNGESCSLIYLLYSDIIEQDITTLQLTLIFLGFLFTPVLSVCTCLN